MYIISDFNGKNTYVDGTGTTIAINSDYQVPSARISYLWDRVMLFAGFTYSGTVFTTPKFLNLFMTYPKPVPSLVPNLIQLTSQHCSPVGYIVHYYDGLVLLERTDYIISIFRNNFSTSDAELTTVGTTTTTSLGDVIPVARLVHILVNGVYSINVVGSGFIIHYQVLDASNTIVEQGILDTDLPLAQTMSKTFTCLAGYHVNIFNLDSPSAEGFDFTFNRVNGYAVSFSSALIDFKASDFINEIMQRFGLTAFKDKYTNHIVFKTVDEILQDPSPEDWSDKFSYRNMTNKERNYIDSVKDKDTDQTGAEVWKPFLRDKQTIRNVKINVDYHCCDIYTLLARFYTKKIEPTCIFIIIGTLILLLLLKLL